MVHCSQLVADMAELRAGKEGQGSSAGKENQATPPDSTRTSGSLLRRLGLKKAKDRSVTSCVVLSGKPTDGICFQACAVWRCAHAQAAPSLHGLWYCKAIEHEASRILQLHSLFRALGFDTKAVLT